MQITDEEAAEIWNRANDVYLAEDRHPCGRTYTDEAMAGRAALDACIKFLIRAECKAILSFIPGQRS